MARFERAFSEAGVFSKKGLCPTGHAEEGPHLVNRFLSAGESPLATTSQLITWPSLDQVKELFLRGSMRMALLSPYQKIIELLLHAESFDSYAFF